jgi:hypothetical protein
MPPKKATADTKGKEPVAAVVEEKEFSIIVQLVDRNVEPIPKYRARVICNWMDCCALTESFGSSSIPWEVPAAQEGEPEPIPLDYKVASHRYEYSPNIASTDQLESFNKNPGLYAILLTQTDEIQTPMSFIYVDCSEYILCDGKQSKRTEVIDGVYLEMTVICRKPLVPSDTAISYDPLVVTFGRLANYPRLDIGTLNSLEQAFDKVYLYGQLDFGSFTRFVFSRPLYDGSCAQFRGDGQLNNLQGDFCLSTCMLPGMKELSLCHQKLLTSTFNVQLHDEDVSKRVFHERNIGEYQRLTKEANPPATETAHAGGKGGKESKAPAAKKGKDAAPDVGSPSTPPESITLTDKFLVSCIANALQASEKIYTHGTARFRLDPLLRSSEDLLLEFQRRRTGSGQSSTGDVVLKDSVNVEIRLQKPSKPIKWSMPTDISIKKMLQQSMDQDQSKLNGTLAPVLPTALPMNVRPRYELFFVSETSLKITAKLIRK